MKRKNVFLVPAIWIITLSAALIFIFLFLDIGSNSVILTINNVPVTTEEFHKYMHELKSVTFAYFADKYEVTDSKSFWTNDFNGEIPLQKLKSRVVDEIKKIRVKQILAEENEIESYMDYAEFKVKLKKENIRRKKAKEKNEIIYGPAQYEERAYYRYVLGNMDEEIKKKLGNGILAVTESDEKLYYERNKEKYKLADYIKAEKISVSYEKVEDTEKLKAIQNKATRICGQINAELKLNGKFEDAARKYINSDDIYVIYTNQVFDSKSRKHDTLYPVLLSRVQELHIGNISDVIIERDGSLNLVRVVERKVSGYMPFNEVKEKIKNELFDRKYNALITEMVLNADVVINTREYQSLKFD